jgi:Domain of unknown function (DUF4336)
MLTRLALDLWTAEQPLKLLGMEMGTRMSVIRLRAGGLFIHSPIGLDAQLRSELDHLGPVEYVISPNRLHHLFVGDFMAAYPSASYYAAPGLASKRPDLKFTATLDSAAAPAWADQIDQLWCDGSALLNEVVFFHRVSRTLILTDIAFNIRRSESTLSRILLTLDGAYGRFGGSHIAKLMFMASRSKWRATIDRILEWDFDRIIVAHGDIVPTDGKRLMRDAFQYL